MIHICLRQPRQVVQTEPTRKVEKKKKKKGRLWTTNANRLQITVNLKKIHHLRRAFRRFCASSHPSYKCFMLENLAFFHNSSKTPDNADIANRKHYSAPAGALTMFFGTRCRKTTSGSHLGFEVTVPSVTFWCIAATKTQNIPAKALSYHSIMKRASASICWCHKRDASKAYDTADDASNLSKSRYSISEFQHKKHSVVSTTNTYSIFEIVFNWHEGSLDLNKIWA